MGGVGTQHWLEEVAWISQGTISASHFLVVDYAYQSVLIALSDAWSCDDAATFRRFVWNTTM